MIKLAIALSTAFLVFASFSNSSHYGLQNYNVGSGGTNSASSTSYKLNGETGGSITGGSTSSTNRITKPSSIQAQQANVPLAPTLSDGSGTYYNQLGFIINMSGVDPNDYTYAVAVSTNNFVTTQYVQANGTLGATQVYQTYSAWGSSGGSTITGLVANTNYQVKVGAKQGLFTNSQFGPSASKSTNGPQLTFTLSPSTVSLGSLTAGSIISGGSSIAITFVTNAAAGGSVYIAGANGGLHSTAVSNTIADYNGDLASPTSGFGVNATSSQSTGGPFSVLSPFNSGGSIVGPPTSTFQQLITSTAPLTGGSGTVVVKAKAATITPAAADYQEILTFVASASF